MKAHSPRRAALTACYILLALVSVSIGATPVPAETPETDPVVIRYLNDRGYVPPFEIADALGLLEGTGVRLKLEGYSPGGPKSLAALNSGAVDVAGAATPAIINAIADGAGILCVIPRAGVTKDVNSKFFVLADSPISRAEDLKGRSIAVNALGAHLDYTIREYLRLHGLNGDDVKLVKVPGSQLDQALRQRQADVAAVGVWQAPIASKIAAEGGVRVLFTDHDVLGDIVLASNAMKRTFIDRHPQAVRAFATASAKAVDWVAAHPGEARRLVAQLLKKRGEDPAGAADWSGYGLREHALYEDHDTQFWLDLLVRAGKLKPGQFSPDDIATNKYNADAWPARH